MNLLRRPLSCPFFRFNDSNFTTFRPSTKTCRTNETISSQNPIFHVKFSDPTMPFFTANSPSLSSINTHLLNSLIQPTLSSKTRTFPKIRTFCDKKPNPNAELSASNDIPVVSTFGPQSQSSQPIDAGSSMRKPISLWPGMYHSPVTNALWEARSSMFEKIADGKQDSQSELAAKTPSRSRTSIVYNFSSDLILREQYRNPWNEIRIGKLLEDLDALAGTISYKHCRNDDGATRPLLLVTASVDKMVLKKPIRIDCDLRMSGAVTWVGRSSMEIQLEITQSIQGSAE